MEENKLKICKVCGLEQPNHKMSCKDSNKEYVIPTAGEFLENQNEHVKNHFLSFDKEGKETYKEYASKNPLRGMKDVLNDFTNLHLDNAIKEWSEYLTWCALEYTTPLTYVEWLKDYKLRNKLN